MTDDTQAAIEALDRTVKTLDEDQGIYKHHPIAVALNTRLYT